MKEKTLLKIALIAGIIGIIILFLISDYIDINETAIDKINKDNIGEDVKIKGIISKITKLEEASIIEIEQPSKITVVAFENLSLYKGDNVEIIGEIEEYNGNVEVIAQRIRLIN